MTKCFLILSVTFLQPNLPAQIGAGPKADDHLQTVDDSKYRAGDVWEYETRTGEGHSRLIVLKLERSSKLGIIVHVAVDNLFWKACQGDRLPEAVPHMPFARKAIDASVTRRVATGHSLPAYKDGYEIWRRDYSRGHAGVYVSSVKDAVAVAEETWRTGLGCGKRE